MGHRLGGWADVRRLRLGWAVRGWAGIGLWLPVWRGLLNLFRVLISVFRRKYEPRSRNELFPPNAERQEFSVDVLHEGRQVGSSDE